MFGIAKPFGIGRSPSIVFDSVKRIEFYLVFFFHYGEYFPEKSKGKNPHGEAHNFPRGFVFPTGISKTDGRLISGELKRKQQQLMQ